MSSFSHVMQAVCAAERLQRVSQIQIYIYIYTHIYIYIYIYTYPSTFKGVTEAPTPLRDLQTGHPLKVQVKEFAGEMFLLVSRVVCRLRCWRRSVKELERNSSKDMRRFGGKRFWRRSRSRGIVSSASLRPDWPPTGLSTESYSDCTYNSQHRQL